MPIRIGIRNCIVPAPRLKRNDQLHCIGMKPTLVVCIRSVVPHARVTRPSWPGLLGNDEVPGSNEKVWRYFLHSDRLKAVLDTDPIFQPILASAGDQQGVVEGVLQSLPPLHVSYSAMFKLKSSDLRFPLVETASPEGLLAIGGDLRPERLLEAYRQGIFPWYNEDRPILWWSPDPRAVLLPEQLHVSRSLKRNLRPDFFTATLDTCFRTVIERCAGPRPQYPEGGTWITAAMVEAYTRLHELGYAHSVEIWLEKDLVGGVYGIAIGGAFFAESMFTLVDDASKVALVRLVHQLRSWGFRLIDCQQSSPHVMRFGAKEIPRREFSALLSEVIKLPTRRGRWEFDDL